MSIALKDLQLFRVCPQFLGPAVVETADQRAQKIVFSRWWPWATSLAPLLPVPLPPAKKRGTTTENADDVQEPKGQVFLLFA